MFDKQNKFDHLGWKSSYKLIKKKAMDQELSWTGLAINLSIAFFIVAASATFLNITYRSLNNKEEYRVIEGQRLIEAGSLVRVFVLPVEAAVLELSAQPSKDTLYKTLYGGQNTSQTITLKNTGKSSWKPGEITFETGPYLKTFSKLQTSSWLKFYQPIKLTHEVKSGQTIDIIFPIKAPTDIEGTIQENFQLVKNERPIPGSLVRVFVTIVKPSSPVLPAPSPVIITPMPVLPNTSIIPSNPNLSAEPIIRVGLFNPTTAQRVVFNGIFDVVSSAETLFAAVTANQAVSVTYNPASRAYAVSLGTQTKLTASPLRFVARSSDSVATLLDYKNGPAWNPSASDNRFRGVIEYRYTEPAKKIWFINELPLETYLKGLAETSNAGALEYQKVMATAARSYAFYHYTRGLIYGLTDASTKHAADHFHIDSYYDQVYRGYNSEIRMPRLAAAVDMTRGMAVSYQGKPVVTPYFSNSDGRTRDWTEVWGGSAVPWLKSVVVAVDSGKTLFGHGVGLSARAAAVMANGGQDWQTILKYFYSGIELLKIY